MNFDAGLLLSGIATLSGLIQVIILLSDHNREREAYRKLRYAMMRMEQPLRNGTKVLSEVLTEEHQENLYDKLNDTNTIALEKISSKDLASINILEMKRIMCDVLHNIKQENGGSLPTKRLNKLWEEYYCEDFIQN